MAKAAPISDSITQQLRSLMQQQDIVSFRALAQAADISEGQVLQFRRGNAPKMRLTMLQKLAGALQVDLPGLLAIAGIPGPASSPAAAVPEETGRTENAIPEKSSSERELRAEYDRLKQQLATQETELLQRFQQDSLYILEAWMKNWPRVVHAVQTDKPDLAAAKILPLIKPLEQLLAAWHVETIGCIGTSLPYDPQEHQLIGSQAQPGEPVTISRPGYRQENRLLHRAEVKRQS